MQIGVRVAANGELYARVPRHLGVDVVQVQSFRLCIDFQGTTRVLRMCDQAQHEHLNPCPPKQKTRYHF
jgi:hypothetical protein